MKGISTFNNQLNVKRDTDGIILGEIEKIHADGESSLLNKTQHK